MRIRISVSLALATAAWLATPLSPAALSPAAADPEKASPKCTIIGTNGPDVLRGTKHADYICGLGGDDKIIGRGGDDILKGGGGDDLIIGGPGNDVLGGGRGDDTLDGRDDPTAKDKLRCGRGEDTAKADPPDVARPRCEHVEQDDAPTDVSLAPTSVPENEPAGTVVGTLSATDPDVGDTHSFTLVSGAGSADNASFAIAGAQLRTNGPFDFETTPTRSVRVRATDSGGLFVEKALTVTVTDVDDPPVAVDDTKTVTEDDPATPIAVLANDTDTDAGPMSVASVTQPTHGTVVVTGGGSGLTYAPDANYCNTPTPPTDDFTYTLNGGDVGAVAVTVTCVDDDPVAVDDALTVAEDDPATAVGVLANDTDVDAGPKSIASVTQPTHGTVVITGGGTGLTYAPDANYCNDGTPTDDFTYTLTPGGSTATVQMTISCTDDPPTAVNDSATVSEDAAAAPVAVLSNDTDIDGGPKTITSTSQPANGTVAIIGGGAGLTYAPDADYCNSPPGTTPDTFTYTLNGGSSATVSMTVTCVDDTPVAVDDTKTVAEDAPATAVNVLANDTDVDGGPISIDTVTQPANGTVVITGGGSGLTYQPDPDYCNDPGAPGDDTFTYTLNGGSTATVSVAVTCSDDTPVAVNDSATVPEDSVATTVDVLANDTDVDGGPISIDTVTQPANGTVVITGGGSGLTYQPDPDYCNSPPGTTPDTFTYTLSPGGSTATVSVTVTCVDDPPVAVDDSATVIMNAPATAVTVLANDTDVDGGAMSIDSVTQPADGTVVITGGGTGLTYEPDPGSCNDGTPTDDFTYTLNGGSSATVKMTVTCDVAPTAVNDSATVTEDSAASAVDVLANDTDPDAGPKSVGSVTQPANGTVVITGGGTGLTYAPDANYCNSPPGTTLDTFTYDLAPGGDSATVSMTVTCVDDAPSAVGDSATVAEDSGAGAVDVLANDTDVDGGPKSIQSVTQPANGTVAITGGGTGLTYAPNANYCNAPPGTTPDTFSYTLNGGSTATVSMTVTCAPDAPVVTAGGTLAYTENDAPTVIAPALTVTDADTGATITGATVQITGNYAGAQDVLALSNAGSHAPISASLSGDTLTLSGPASPAAYQAALRDVTYANTSDAPSTLTRTVTFTVTDDTALTGSAARNVSVAAVDDPPVAVNDSFQGIEDSGAVAVPVLTNDTDVDGGPKSIGTVTQPANGTVAITGGGTGLTYAPNADYCNDPPGTSPDTFTYTLNGGSSATVSVKVTCVNDNPVADNETLTVAAGNSAVGNTRLGVGTSPAQPSKSIARTGATDVLVGDTDVDGPGPLTVVSAGSNPAADNGLTADGGTVTIAANGDFTYTPAANDPGCTDTSDSFDYVVSDQYPGTPGTDIGTVTIQVADCVWYVDSSVAGPGTGTSSDPFKALSGVNGAGGAGDADGAGDTVMILDGSSYSGGLPLENNQVLRSKRAGLTVGGNTIVTAAGASNPTITNGSGNAVTLASGNTIQGIDLGSTPAGSAALFGNGVGTATVNTVTTGAITNSTGGAVDVSNGTLAMSFTGISSTGATGSGIRLSNVTGSFTGSGGTISNATGADIDISGGASADDATITYDGAIADTTGTVLSVSGQGGGTKDFNGTIGTAATPAGAVSLTNNTGATIRLDGGTILSTGATNAFTATGGGTVVVTDPNAVGTAPDNTLTTTTGTALNVANTTIGSDGLKFRSISANGATNGVLLNNTGGTAGLTVSGNGGSCSSAGTCSGGAILNTTSAVSLTSTRDVSIDRMFIQNSTADGIDGTSTTNFAFTNGRIDNSGTGGGAETSNIGFNTTAAGTENNLSGTVTITGNTLTSAFYHGIDVFNFNGTISNADISGNTITSTTSTATSKGSGIRFVAFGSASTIANVTKASITNNVVTNFPSGAGIQAQGGNGNLSGPAGVFGTAGSATNVIAITGNQVSGASAANRLGTFAIAAVVNGKGQGAFDISNNGTVANPLGNSTGIAISLGSFGSANVSATVDNNVIAAHNQSGAPGIGAGTSQTWGASDSPTLTVTVNNNTISQTDGNGILVTARDATGHVNATIKNNNVAAPLSANRNGIRVDAGNSVSVDDDVCLDIAGNTSAGSGLSPEAIGLRKQGTSSTVNAFGIEGMAATSSPGVESFVSSQQNPGSQSTLLISATSGFSNCNTAP